MGDISQTDIDKTQKHLAKLKKDLQKKKNQARYQHNFRKKNKLHKINYKNNSGVKITVQDRPGRPRLEESQVGLLQTISDIAIHASQCHDRRRTEEIKTSKTLDDLHKKLSAMDFKISKSALYLRLQPKNSKTLEGKRHVITAPVRLVRAENDFHKSHPDGHFCTTTIRCIESLVSLLGNKQVAFISQDDKARVQIGVTAAHKQSPMLMHMQYRVKLPDHDWVVAAKHSLIPSVYAGIMINSGTLGSPEAVTYSGPTYIAIRSGKHSSSTACTHADDFENLYKLEDFHNIMYLNGQKKPIVVISVDGGPDENPRYPKTIAFAVKHFKIHSLDAIFIVTNAPGRSAFNRVERRMARLSYELSGLILPHDSYGNHLNSKHECIDKELELKKFAAAGEALADVWSQLNIDSFPVKAEYIHPVEPKLPENCDAKWYAEHVRESQYFLQVVKCDDLQCCKPFRSNIKSVLKDRFFPPPLRVKEDPFGKLEIVAPLETSESNCQVTASNASKFIKFLPFFPRLTMDISSSEMEKYKILPYDFQCPSIQKDIKERICSVCHIYFATKKSVLQHKKECHPKEKMRAPPKRKPKKVITTRNDEKLCIIADELTGAEDSEWVPVDEIEWHQEDVPLSENQKEDVLIINSLDQWLQSEWSVEG